MHSQDADPEIRKNGNASRWRLAAGYLVAAACLAWVLFNVHPKNLLQNVRNLKWYLIILAIAVDNLNYITQGLRWRVLLKPIAEIRPWKVIQATYVAMFTSNVLPMRFGEIVRAYLISKWCAKKISEIIPSMVVEHLFEGIWLSVGIGMATLFLPLPAYVKRGAQVFAFGVIVLAGVFFYALIQKEKSQVQGAREHLRQKLVHKIKNFMDQLSAGMRKIGLSAPFFYALALTLVSLGLQSMALWLVAMAYGIPIAVWKGAVVLVIIRVGVVIPNAPANLGTYQFFAALGLELLGVNRYVATGFAIVLFFVLMTPTWVTGFFALSQSGTTLLRLQHDAREASRN
jgi:glycosyltransferase 2 family protein